MRRWRPKKRSSRRAAISTRILSDWRKQGLRIGFTNGCFDILHPGHVKVLTAARGACDRLIVGLNSDASVKRLKGEGRPVQDERARAEVLAALEAVDLVVIFEEDTPIDLITQIKPSVLVKGGDYTREQVVGHEIVEAAWRRSGAGRYPAGLQHDLAGRSRARRQGVSADGHDVADRQALPVWRDPAAWMTTADIVAVLIALSLPWSTSLVGIFGVRPGSCTVAPSLDCQSFLAIAEAPDLLRCRSRCSCWRWSERCGRTRAWGARLYAVGPAAKLLVLPVLFYHFERSTRGMWVFVAFLVSCTLLMADVLDRLLRSRAFAQARGDAERGIFVKNYIDQSQEFALCAVALAYPIVTLLRAEADLAGAAADRDRAELRSSTWPS